MGYERLNPKGIADAGPLPRRTDPIFFSTSHAVSTSQFPLSTAVCFGFLRYVPSVDPISQFCTGQPPATQLQGVDRSRGPGETPPNQQAVVEGGGDLRATSPRQSCSRLDFQSASYDTDTQWENRVYPAPQFRPNCKPAKPKWVRTSVDTMTQWYAATLEK